MIYMAKILPITINPNPILRKKSAELGEDSIKSPETKELCFDMGKTMLEKDGVGLAAPQIGKNIRIIAVNIEGKPTTMINPKILKKSWRKEIDQEGCLSVPDTFGQVKRHKKISYCYFDNSGKKIKDAAEGLLARVIQHEVDHLDGILFIDKAKNVKTNNK